MLIAFAVVLLDLIGFGIMVPILAFYVLQLGGGPEMATFCMALYVIGMFISTPILGRRAYYDGRKPVLILSMVGAIIGYIILGFAESVWVVAISRLVGGLMAGNIAAAQAYITDISSPENRAKAMGMIGAAFGLGFIIGPALGAYLAGDTFEGANLFLPAMLSAFMSFSALLVIIFALPESLDKAHREELRAQKRVTQWQAFTTVVKHPIVVLVLLACFIFNTAAGFVEAIFPLWSDATDIAKGPKDLIPLLLIAGVAMVIVQGGLMGPLSRKFGEERLVIGGAVIFAVSMVGLTIAGSYQFYYGVMLGLIGQSCGTALILTPLQSLVSQCADHTNRGMVMGVYSSAGTCARGVGTLLTGVVFANISINSPYLIGATLMGLLLMVSLVINARWQVHQNSQLDGQQL